MSKNFTIIELLVVLSLTAVLSAIAIPSYYDSEKFVNKSKDKFREIDLATIQTELENYYLETGHLPIDTKPTFTTPVRIQIEDLQRKLDLNVLEIEGNLNFWIDYDRTIRYSTVELPEDVCYSSTSGLLSWNPVTGAKQYNIYGITQSLSPEQYEVSLIKSVNGYLSETYILKQDLQSLNLKQEFFLVSAVDENGFETALSGYDSEFERTIKPIASFYSTPNLITSDTIVTWVDNSYSPVDRQIDNAKWTNNNRLFTKAGNYDISLSVSDSKGLTSDVKQKSITVYPHADYSKILASGNTHSMYLSSNGVLYTWGENENGQVGEIISGSSTEIPREYINPSKIIQLAAGEDFSFAVTEDGQVYSWGNPEFGELGYNLKLEPDLDQYGNPTDYNFRPDPIGVVRKIESLSNIQEVSAGDTFALALDKSGYVYAWGKNSSGQLGLNKTTTQESPQKISSLHNVKQIVAGNNHSLALLEDGTILGWGDNTYGQLGIGLSGSGYFDSPMILSDLTNKNIKYVFAFENASAATTADNRLYVWGQTDLLSYNSLVPVQITSITNVKQIAGSKTHTLVLLNNGDLYAVGHNDFGELGLGEDYKTQLRVNELTKVKGISNVLYVSTAEHYSLAMTRAGQLMEWGQGVNTPQMLNSIPVDDKPTRIDISYYDQFKNILSLTDLETTSEQKSSEQ